MQDDDDERPKSVDDEDAVADPEVRECRPPLFPFQKLEAYGIAKELARRVQQAKIRDTELRDQATRAAKSTFLRLCEGLPNDSAAMRRKYFVEAYNSLHETVGAMDLAQTIGAVSDEDAAAAQALAWRLRGLIMGLLR